MKKLFSNERSKWIFAIGLIAISTGFIARNVVSYPSECNTQTMSFLNQ